MIRQPSPITKIDNSRIPLREKVLSTLRSAIMNFQLMPGDRLVERDLCDMLGVSRTSVREALRHLESEGLVDYLENKGPIVTRLTLETAREIYELRASLESLIVQLYTINATDKQLHMLETSLDLLTRRLTQGNVANILESVNDFYELLYEGCGNQTAAKLLRQQQARVNLLRATSISQENRYMQSIEEMRAIVEAIKKRDKVAAHYACIQHVKRASEVALSAMAEKEEVTDIPVIFVSEEPVI
ncbi:GntR family transcriptional regulator [Vibrio japonicus]|uniref:GntR family transcriptional regulator n=1 Tax=Vibrio japonicus TaxID=1824638 RepID=A0ABY5LEU0_9VIBR|nr:GntR family transcriptional regulator [Vibrio japonicus]UUM29680.1 GntR family transcriptional regulator [Vibrio japonicus]